MVDLPASGMSAFTLAAALVDGGARVLQLRCKKLDARAMLAALHEIRAAAPGVMLIVNDRVDVALAGRADGVHLGQTDLPLAQARKLAPNLLIGISTHNLAQVEAARGADYIGFGPVFSTSTKENPDPVVGLDNLRAACSHKIPVVAIGGIELSHIAAVVTAGAHCAAVIRAVNQAPDVTTAARTVSAAFGAGAI
jgi:thiamine-phosphate pyrophosphorylase